MTKQLKKSQLTRSPKLKSEETTVSADRPATKLSIILQLLNQDKGATLAALATASGWQEHSVRGFMSGTLKKKRGLNVTSEIIDGNRHYCICKGRSGR